MWVQAGFSPCSFWQQTPRLFQLTMEAVGKRLRHEADFRTEQAYETGAFAGLAHHGKLKALKHYQRKQSPQTPSEMVAMIKTMGARSNMTIRRVKRET